MTEQELRLLVREAIARYDGAAPPVAVHGRGQVPASAGAHASHAMFTLPAGADSDGPCLIEPAVLCTHCGYCKSYGH